MKKFLNIKAKIEWIFWVLAFILLLAMIGYTIYTINFLAKRINLILAGDIGGQATIIRFDFEKMNQVLSGRLPTPAPE